MSSAPPDSAIGSTIDEVGRESLSSYKSACVPQYPTEVRLSARVFTNSLGRDSNIHLRRTAELEPRQSGSIPWTCSIADAGYLPAPAALIPPAAFCNSRAALSITHCNWMWDNVPLCFLFPITRATRVLGSRLDTLQMRRGGVLLSPHLSGQN
jgi:hypothetical protein